MMRRVLKALLVLAITGGGAILAVPSAFAYTIGNGCTANAPASASAGQSFSFSVACKLSNGQTLPAGTHVTFSQSSGPAGCTVTFDPLAANADPTGSVSTTVALPVGCPGNYMLTATAATGASVSVTVTEVGSGGFPNTSANPPLRALSSGWLVPATSLVLIGIIVAAGAFLLKARGSR